MKRRELLQLAGTTALSGAAILAGAAPASASRRVRCDALDAWGRMLLAMADMSRRGWPWDIHKASEWELNGPDVEIVITMPIAKGPPCPVGGCPLIEVRGPAADMPAMFVALHEQRVGPMKEE